ncbi:hypothetical protein LOZ52_004990 [Ophidiomyces ophidiicola]|nr:hypothetical protein LOZ49_005722 [Ophidiomyces ophidiicola]KAI2014462.1 hypothetical protein LOZ46_005510 [Ophidiomyces ophidiicola]KAI2214402.1 hypothetical protein LOZ15_004779 [Ophidiomyces ophidiicola]KAI2403399.1 hypothetical protein LOZ67_000437 [Ophidiomyces ophidiicola]KAI2424376.1 hypothetical protein LOZ52_004990 [Ophidiomyces ophidiicola]
MLLIRVFLGAILCHLAWARSSLSKDQLCLNSIYRGLRAVSFADVTSEDRWQATCQSRLRAASIYATAKLYCTPAEIKAGDKVLQEYCVTYGNVEFLPMSAVAANLTDERIKTYKTVNQKDIKLIKKSKEPVVMSKPYYDLAYRTIYESNRQSTLHHTYGFAMYGFWGGIVFFGIVYRLYIVFFNIKRSRFGVDEEGNGSNKHSLLPRPLAKISHWFQTTLVIPGAIKPYHQRPFYWCAIPTRLEGLVIGGFWLISFVLCAVNYRVFEGNIYWATVGPQYAAYIADRTGIITYYNLPIVWIFGIRNNIFLWATGWSFRTFNLFHRHVARIATFEGIVHSIAYTVYYFIRGGAATYKENFTEVWFAMGAVATVVMSFLLIFSSIWLRMKSYEVFLLLHIALSIVTIVALFHHTWVFKTREYDAYLWPLVAIWVFDRTLRIIRLVYCNLRVRLGSKFLQNTETVAIYDKDSDVIRLEVTPASTSLKLRPGQHYYLYQPFRWTGYENHPFTLGAWANIDSQPSQSTTPGTAISSSDASPVASLKGLDTSMQRASPRSEVSTKRTTQAIFWIRPLDGWTNHLRKQCEKAKDGRFTTTLLMEGPYGECEPLSTFEYVLLIVGGTGVASAVPYIQDHIERTSAQNEASSKKNTRTRDMKLVWAAREPAFMQQVASRELRPALVRNDFSATFYSTSKSTLPSQTINSEKVLEDDIKPQEKDCTTLNLQYGRPDIKSMILNSAAETAASNSSMAVLVCGPPGLADEARDAVHAAMRQGHQHVKYFEEAFGW